MSAANASGIDAISKQADRILALLTISFSLSQIRFQQEDLREARETRELIRLNEKFNEQLEVLSGKSTGATANVQGIYEELFRYGSPRGISPNSLPLHDQQLLSQIEDLTVLDPQAYALNLFISNIKPYITVTNDLRSLVKLYTPIGLEKLNKLSITLASEEVEHS